MMPALLTGRQMGITVSICPLPGAPLNNCFWREQRRQRFNVDIKR
jgi:hypothetical protein